jgi:hypothetical protein
MRASIRPSRGRILAIGASVLVAISALAAAGSPAGRAAPARRLHRQPA